MRIAAGIRGANRAQRLSLIAAIGIGAMAFTGCSAINQQSTTMKVTVSDGVNTDLGQLQLRNVLVVSEAAGAPGNIAGTFYNRSDSDITLTVSGAKGARAEITVAPGAPKVLGVDTPRVELDPVVQAPGSIESLELSTSAGESKSVKVPVLDGTLAEYKPMLPTEAPATVAP